MPIRTHKERQVDFPAPHPRCSTTVNLARSCVAEPEQRQGLRATQRSPGRVGNKQKHPITSVLLTVTSIPETDLARLSKPLSSY